MKAIKLNKFNMKKDIVKDIIEESSQLESSKGKELKVLLEQILNDQDTTEGLDEFQDQEDGSESWQTEETDDGAQEPDFGDTEPEEPAKEETVTIEFTKDEVDLLRSILSKVDGGDDDVEVEDDTANTEAAEDDSEENDTEETEEDEEDEEVEDDMAEEEEEVEVAKGSPSQYAKTFDSAAPSRKKQTPPVNRKYEADAPDINRDRANGEGDAALGNGAPARKKHTPTVNRQGHVTNTRIKPGKDVFHIGK